MIALRPQPLGIFPPPAANLLLPAVEAAEPLQALLLGDVPDEFPAEWQFFAAATRGERTEAIRLLGDDPSPLGRYNRFVLQPSAATYHATRQQLSGDLA